jgi:hypothetical protein
MANKSGDNSSMSTKDQILWIDDDESRKQQSDNLKEKTGINTVFISLRNKNVPKIIADIRSKYNPSLIIIDHVLSNTASGEWAQLGSTLVGFFRETWEKCPIIGITAAKNLKKIDTEKYAYNELVNFIDFSNYINCIPNIIKGFKQCSKVKDINEWIELLKPPKDEMERISTCIPHDMKIDVEKKGFANRSYSWFNKKFYRLPGFLYNKEWVATFIGVKIDAVDKYLKYLDDAKYNGIFNNPDDTRWWKAKLYQSIYSKCKDKNAASRIPQDVANEEFKVENKFRSKCHVCGKQWPEIMAYVDNSENASLKQMHLRCTLAHPLYEYEPMFEEIRVMAE